RVLPLRGRVPPAVEWIVPAGRDPPPPARRNVTRAALRGTDVAMENAAFGVEAEHVQKTPIRKGPFVSRLIEEDRGHGSGTHLHRPEAPELYDNVSRRSGTPAALHQASTQGAAATRPSPDLAACGS